MSHGSCAVSGLQRAIERYGQPVERECAYQVTKDSLLYWRMVVRNRRAEVVLPLRRRNGLYLLHTKDFYPQGTIRLLTGGVKPREDLLHAVRREALEETGLDVGVERFLGIIHHRFARGEEEVRFGSYLFLLAEVGGTLGARDEGERISGFREVSLDGILAEAERLEALPPDWVDWGRFRAAGHRLVWEALSEGAEGAHGD